MPKPVSVLRRKTAPDPYAVADAARGQLRIERRVKGYSIFEVTAPRYRVAEMGGAEWREKAMSGRSLPCRSLSRWTALPPAAGISPGVRCA